MARTILSLAISLVASVLGYLALWSGGVVLMRNAIRARGADFDGFSLLLVIIGVVLLAIAMLSVALSSVGVMTVGVIHLVFGLLAVLIPSTPFIRLIAQGFGADSALGSGLLFSVTTGIGMLAGTIFLVAGLAALPRRSQKPGMLARASSLVVALVAGAMGVVLAFMGGGSINTNLLVFARSDPDASGILLLVVGTVLVGLAVLTLRWSSLGAAVFGIVVLAAGFIGIALPGQLASVTNGVSRELTVAVQFASQNGNLALLGMLVLSAALGTMLRARRRG